MALRSWRSSLLNATLPAQVHAALAPHITPHPHDERNCRAPVPRHPFSQRIRRSLSLTKTGLRHGSPLPTIPSEFAAHLTRLNASGLILVSGHEDDEAHDCAASPPPSPPSTVVLNC
jgi:hypothetical protein